MKIKKAKRRAVAKATREATVHERIKVKPGLWIELPVGLSDTEKGKRIQKYLAKLEEKYPIYNPKAA